MKRFDCRLSGDELWVARDPKHHYLTKFRLRYGEWVRGSKRGRIKIKENHLPLHIPRVTMTMGYYENLNMEFNLKLRESNYNMIMEYAAGQ